MIRVCEAGAPCNNIYVYIHMYICIEGLGLGRDPWFLHLYRSMLVMFAVQGLLRTALKPLTSPPKGLLYCIRPGQLMTFACDLSQHGFRVNSLIFRLCIHSKMARHVTSKAAIH